MADPVVVAQVRATAEARRMESGLKTVLDEKRKAFDADNEALIQQHRLAVVRRETAEDALRHLALQVVAETGDTKPAPGVATRQTTKVEITDDAAALAWAKQTGLCLKVDTKALEAVASHGAAGELPFVRVTREPQITLAKDLDAALATADLTAPTTEPVG